MLKVEDVDYTYKNSVETAEEKRALSGVDISIPDGEFLVLLGRNGSGKSTFARLLNALALPERGFVYIKGRNTSAQDSLWEIRRLVGMVFQNPENQIIGTSVEEDVAFGPENLGIATDEIVNRVEEALRMVCMEEFQLKPSYCLSGGQKQKLAVAGILAMKPECIVLDEATSMLDAVGRKELMRLMKKLNIDYKITIIHITHNTEEAVYADRANILDDGIVVADGAVEKILCDIELLRKSGIKPLPITLLFYELKGMGIEVPLDIIEIEDAVKYFEDLIRK